MKKKFLVIVLSFILISACGKKGDPTYNENSQILESFKTEKNRAA